MASVFSKGSGTLRSMIPHPRGARRRVEAAHTRDLVDIVEHQMIPRLMLAHSRERTVTIVEEHCSIAPGDAEDFAVNVLEWEADRALLEVEGLMSGGHDIRSIFLDLLAPAARKLGMMWEEDECDFVEVTMGLWRLQEVMREIASRTPPLENAVRAPARALFSAVPGDQHGFGALMIDEVFARAGWESEALIDPERRELLSVIAQKSFDLVGLTVTNDCPSSALQSLIRAIRTVSSNPQTCIMIGGRMVNANPGIADEVGQMVRRTMPLRRSNSPNRWSRRQD